MSVVGIDIGTAYGSVAVARKGGIDVVMNEVSKRLTPTVVCFAGKERQVGDMAASGLVSQPRNTVANIRRIIGRTWDEEDVKVESKYIHVPMGPAEDGKRIEFTIDWQGTPTKVTPEAVMAQVLAKLKEVAENANDNLPVAEAVLSVPGFFTDAQRRAVLDAADLAGIKVTKLMSEVTATALAYGIFKQDLPEDKPDHVLFVDVGAATTSVALGDLSKGKLEIRASAYDRHLGGRDFDNLLLDHFIAEFDAKYKLDIRSSPKALVRMAAAVEKMKRVLSANALVPINIECLLNDVDVSGTMKREDFVAMAAPLVARVLDPVRKVMADSGLTWADLRAIEVVGGASRIPAIATAIEKESGREISRTLNADEVVARGCALQAAMLSPLFRVREFSVSDVNPYAISMSWAARDSASGDEPASSMVFGVGNPVPSTKLLSFFRSKPFDVTVCYSEPDALPKGVSPTIGVWTVAAKPPKGATAAASGADGEEDPKIKVKVKLNAHGIVNVESAYVVTEVEEKVPVVPDKAPDAKKTADKPKADDAKADGDAAEKQEDGDTPMAEAKEAGADKPDADKPEAEAEADKAGAEADKAEAEAKDGEGEGEGKFKIRKKTVKTEIKVSGGTTAGLTPEALAAARELEGKMQAHDHLVRDTAAAQNSLESYVYEMREKLSTTLGPYAPPGFKDEFTEKLNAEEEWLYSEEGEEASKSVFLERLAALKKQTDPIVARLTAEESLPKWTQWLTQSIAWAEDELKAEDPKYAHISEDDKKPGHEAVEAARKWLSDTVAKLEAAPKHEDAPVTLKDWEAAGAALKTAVDKVLSKPKPVEVVDDAKKDEAKPDDAAAAAKDGEAKPEGEAAAAGEAGAEAKDGEAAAAMDTSTPSTTEGDAKPEDGTPAAGDVDMADAKE